MDDRQLMGLPIEARLKQDKKPKLWVLLREYNAYDQYGSYFVAVWSTKPTVEQLDEVYHGNDREIESQIADSNKEWWLMKYGDAPMPSKFNLHLTRLRETGVGQIMTEYQMG